MCDGCHLFYVYKMLGLVLQHGFELLCRDCWTLLSRRELQYRMVLLELTLSSLTSWEPDLNEVPFNPIMVGPPSEDTQIPNRSEYASK